MSSNLIDLIKNSGLFDAEFYSLASGQTADVDGLIEHYIENGEASGLSPSISFDPSMYRVANPDLTASSQSVNFLSHYILYGKNEGRYGCLVDAKDDAAIVAAAKLFDEVYYGQRFPRPMLKFTDPITDQILFWRLGRRPYELFDDVFYFTTYADARQSGHAPFVHYVMYGQYDKRPTNQQDYDSHYAFISQHLDVDYYLTQFPERPNQNFDAVHDYVAGGWRQSRRPTLSFCPYFYLAMYSDLRQANVEPFIHFIQHGRAEGRLGRPVWATRFSKGHIDFDPSRPTIMIANHEASRTGAPLVGLNLAAALCDSFNVIIYLQAAGELEASFYEYATVVVSGRADTLTAEYLFEDLLDRYNLDCVVLNSAEVGHLARPAGYHGIASVSLVHEFSENTLPRGRTSDIVRFSDFVVVPSMLVRRSTQDEVFDVLGSTAPNIVVHPQGKLNFIPPIDGEAMSSEQFETFLSQRASGRTKVVLGAGGVGMRKGVDLFVQTAAEMNKFRNDVVFVWIGDGYRPNHDINYSVWVSETISRLGMQDIVHIIPAQSNLDSFLARCDVFYLPSRLDPYPNVVIDALDVGLPIVCFDRATGFAEHVTSQEIYGRAVTYGDVGEAARALSDLIGTRESHGGVNIDFTRTKLNFNRYTAFVKSLRSDAIENRLKLQAGIERLKREESLFDRRFSSGGTDFASGHQPLTDYAVSSSKGLAFNNPRPGFSDALFYDKEEVLPGEVALLRAADAAGAPPHTHECVVISKGSKISDGSQKRYALHVHAHYPDDLEVIVARLSRYRHPIDLFVTVTNDDVEQLARRVTRALRGSRVVIKTVKNQGRDMKPLLFDLREELSNGYDVIGHVHLKKSLAIGGDTGDHWRHFLLDTLLPEQTLAFKNIISLFEDEQQTGLVFAEDRYNVGWTQNLTYAETVSKRIGLSFALPGRIMFPIGNMFWADKKVLEPFWNSDFVADDFPVEPVRYDGSILHAIERMLPSVCENVGLRWRTVRVDGVDR